MPLSVEQKEAIRVLRAQGCTYSEIQEHLGHRIPQSSLSYICKNILLPGEYQEKIKHLNKAHLESVRGLAVRRNKEKRYRYLQNINLRNEYLLEKVSPETLKFALAMLYLGEGAKWGRSGGLALGSSSPDIINMYISLLGKCYDIPLSRLRVRVQYRADQDITELENYWSSVTGISKAQFYKTQPDARTVGKPTKRVDYRGVCVIMGGGTEVQLELAAIAKLLLKYLGH